MFMGMAAFMGFTCTHEREFVRRGSPVSSFTKKNTSNIYTSQSLLKQKHPNKLISETKKAPRHQDSAFAVSPVCSHITHTYLYLLLLRCCCTAVPTARVHKPACGRATNLFCCTRQPVSEQEPGCMQWQQMQTGHWQHLRAARLGSSSRSGLSCWLVTTARSVRVTVSAHTVCPGPPKSHQPTLPPLPHTRTYAAGV